jgi:hypothetical protein
MTDSLYSYLLQHRSLSIPGLGTILIERVPAQNDFVNRKILPPTYHFRFDKYFDAPDKDFFTFLATQENVADYEVIRQYNEWAFDLRNALRTDEPVPMGDMGSMTRDAGGDIRFLPSQKINAFFRPVEAKRVEYAADTPHHAVSEEVPDRIEEVAPLAEEIYDQEEIKENWKWYTIIMISLILLILFFHFLRKGWSLGSTGMQPLW